MYWEELSAQSQSQLRFSKVPTVKGHASNKENLSQNSKTSEGSESQEVENQAELEKAGEKAGVNVEDGDNTRGTDQLEMNITHQEPLVPVDSREGKGDKVLETSTTMEVESLAQSTSGLVAPDETTVADASREGNDSPLDKTTGPDLTSTATGKQTTESTEKVASMEESIATLPDASREGTETEVSGGLTSVIPPGSTESGLEVPVQVVVPDPSNVICEEEHGTAKVEQSKVVTDESLESFEKVLLDEISVMECVDNIKDRVETELSTDSEKNIGQAPSTEPTNESSVDDLSLGDLEPDVDLLISDPNYMANVILLNLDSSIKSLLEANAYYWKTKSTFDKSVASAQTDWKDVLSTTQGNVDQRPMDAILAHIPYSERSKANQIWNNIQHHLLLTTELTRRFDYYLDICKKFDQDTEEDAELLVAVRATSEELRTVVSSSRSFDWYNGRTQTRSSAEITSSMETIGPENESEDIVEVLESAVFEEMSTEQGQYYTVTPPKAGPSTASKDQQATPEKLASVGLKRKNSKSSITDSAKKLKQMKIDEIFSTTPVRSTASPKSTKTKAKLKQKPKLKFDEEPVRMEIPIDGKLAGDLINSDSTSDSSLDGKNAEDEIKSKLEETFIASSKGDEFIEIRRCIQPYCPFVEKFQIGSNLSKHYNAYHPQKAGSDESKYVKMEVPSKYYDYLKVVTKAVAKELKRIKKTYSGEWLTDVEGILPNVTKRNVTKYSVLAADFNGNLENYTDGPGSESLVLKSNSKRMTTCAHPGKSLPKPPYVSSALSKSEDMFAGGIIVGMRQRISEAASDLVSFNEDLFSTKLDFTRKKQLGVDIGTQVPDAVGERQVLKFIDQVVLSMDPKESGSVLDIRKAVENHLIVTERMLNRLKTIVDKTTSISRKHQRTYKFIGKVHESLKDLDEAFIPTVNCEWYEPEKVVTKGLDLPVEDKVTPVLTTMVSSKVNQTRTKEPKDNKGSKLDEEDDFGFGEDLSKRAEASTESDVNKEDDGTEIPEHEQDQAYKDQLITVYVCKHRTCCFVSAKATTEDLKNHYRTQHPKAKVPVDLRHSVVMPRANYKKQLKEWNEYYRGK
uniref:Uncharacterized protein n=1 Tax=Tetranychus urticae TaxID=32264 RepID=T1L5R0_TETUR